MIHALVTIVLVWFCLVVVKLAWDGTEDTVYDFSEWKEADDGNDKW